MSQKIVTLCDAHQLHDEEVPGVTWTVTLLGPGGTRPTTWEVDLCEEDGKTLVDLGTMLGTVGRHVDGPRKAPQAARNTARTAPQAPEGHPCPVEGCGFVSTSQGGLGAHLRSRHDTTYAQATGAEITHPCPECGKGFTRAQSLGVHRARVHPEAGGGTGAA